MYKEGDEVLVSDLGGVWYKRFFLAIVGDKVWTTLVRSGDKATPWDKHKPIKPYEEYTLETFPKCRCLVKYVGCSEVTVVLFMGEFSIETIRDTLSYADLLKRCEISTDNGKNWKVAGVDTNE